MHPDLVEDVFDVLEGPLDALLRVRTQLHDHLDTLLLASQMRAVRTAIAMLSSLQRAGYEWRPAEDGHEPALWRETMRDVIATHSEDREYAAMVQREVDELVELTPAGPRRSLARLGRFERLARRAGIARRHCIKWARLSGDNLVAGWASCGDPATLMQLALALGTPREEIVRQIVRLLQAAIPEHATELRALLAIALDEPAALDEHDAHVLAVMRGESSDIGMATGLLLHMLARNKTSVFMLESVLERAARAIPIDAFVTHFTTPAIRAQLAAGAS